MTEPNDMKQVEKGKKRGFYKTKLREEFENRWKKIRLDIFYKRNWYSTRYADSTEMTCLKG